MTFRSATYSNSSTGLWPTPSFPHSQPTVKTAKTMSNLVPCANKFAQAFAEFLKNAPDITAFSKLPEQFCFAIEYSDTTVTQRRVASDTQSCTQNRANDTAPACPGHNWQCPVRGEQDRD